MRILATCQVFANPVTNSLSTNAEDPNGDLYLNNIETIGGQAWTEENCNQQAEVTFKVDTGTEVTAVPESTWSKLKLPTALQKIEAISSLSRPKVSTGHGRSIRNTVLAAKFMPADRLHHQRAEEQPFVSPSYLSTRSATRTTSFGECQYHRAVHRSLYWPGHL